MKPNVRRAAGLLSIVAVVALGTAAPAGASGPAGPIRKMALGVSMQPYTDMALLDQFASASGRMPAIWSVWSSWGGASKPFPASLVDQLHSRGVTPMIIWEPSNPSNKLDNSYRYLRIINGRYDTYIRNFAQAAKDHGGRILLRFAHEMNGTWFSWCTKCFDNTPARFRQAWIHIWNIFRGPGGVGATNVKFLWSPNQPCGHCDSMASVYPGNAYVDFVGFSSFNWSNPLKWKTMVQTFALSMTDLAAITTKKVIVTETGSSPDGGNKAAWITNGYPAVYTKWPRIKGVVYFNINTLNVNQRDWRLVTPNGAPLAAYAAILTDARFQGVIG